MKFLAKIRNTRKTTYQVSNGMKPSFYSSALTWWALKDFASLFLLPATMCGGYISLYCTSSPNCFRIAKGSNPKYTLTDLSY